MMRKGWFLLVALFVATSLMAQVPIPIHVIPVVGKAKGGAGTNWVSDVMISNVSNVNGTFGARYFPANVANSFDGTFPKSFALAPGRSMLVKDVVGTWFPAAGASTTGFLVIGDVTPVSCSAPKQMNLVTSSRTYNAADPSKTYGQSIGSSWAAINFTRGQTILSGIRQEIGVPGYRSNVGVVNLSSVPINVTITIYRGDGGKVSTATKTVQPLSLGQWALSDLGAASLPSTGAWASVVMDAASIKIDPCENDSLACLSRCGEGCGGRYSFSRSGAFIAYVSKVDNGSGDAEFIPGVVDWETYNDGCSSSKGVSPLSTLTQRLGLDQPPTFRKIPR